MSMRQDFEAWALRELKQDAAEWKHSDGTYVYLECEWRAWQQATRQAMEPYNELLMAVGRKYTGETRHQTALRYIQQAERSALSDVAAQEVGK